MLLLLIHTTNSARPPPPVVAIVSHPYNSTHEYIATSYIKYLEMSGARSIRIPYEGMDDEGMDWLETNTNALFLMGGSAVLTSGVRDLFDRVRGIDGYPIWGTCLGFEWIMQMVSEDDSIIDANLDAENYSIPLNLTSSAADSRLMNAGNGKEWSVGVSSMLSNHPVTMNNHMHGVLTSSFSENDKLNELFNVLSTNADRKGVEFVSTVESKSASDMIYATQWHPEKNAFEYGVQPDAVVDLMAEDIDHGEVGRRVSFEMGNFLVGQIDNDGVYDGTRALALEESVGRIEGSSFEERLLFKK